MAWRQCERFKTMMVCHPSKINTGLELCGAMGGTEAYPAFIGERRGPKPVHSKVTFNHGMDTLTLIFKEWFWLHVKPCFWAVEGSHAPRKATHLERVHAHHKDKTQLSFKQRASRRLSTLACSSLIQFSPEQRRDGMRTSDCWDILSVFFCVSIILFKVPV